MTKRKKSNGNEQIELLKGRPVQGDDAAKSGTDFADPSEAMAEAIRDAKQGKQAAAAASDEVAGEVGKLLEAIKADVNAHKDKVSGVIMVVTWNDGTSTHGWTGNFDPQQTAGKLFNLATDFAVFDALRRLGPVASPQTMLPKSQLN